MTEISDKEWQCPHCGESHESHMTGCWKCGADRDGERMFSTDESHGEKKSSELVFSEYGDIIKRVEKKHVNQTKSMGFLLVSFVLLGVAQRYGNHIATFLCGTLCLLSLVVILFLRLTMGAIYRCPQCDAKLTLNSKKKGLFNFEVAPLSHCHHCGETLTS